MEITVWKRRPQPPALLFVRGQRLRVGSYSRGPVMIHDLDREITNPHYRPWPRESLTVWLCRPHRWIAATIEAALIKTQVGSLIPFPPCNALLPGERLLTRLRLIDADFYEHREPIAPLPPGWELPDRPPLPITRLSFFELSATQIPPHLDLRDVAGWEQRACGKDDTAATVYADWCEEHDWPARASQLRPPAAKADPGNLPSLTPAV